MNPLHFLLGLSVIDFVIVRLAVRWRAGAAPDIHPPVPPWQDKLARLMHWALYALRFHAGNTGPRLADAECRR